MGWKTDWLYGLIFEQFRAAWRQAEKEGRGRSGRNSEAMLIREHSDFRVVEHTCHCSGEVERVWRYAGAEFEESVQPTDLHSEGVRGGMFNRIASGWFHITPDRRMVIIECVFGPRYGRGSVYDVQGQGTSGRLSGKQDATGWIS